MGIINILDENTINLIAAGEVVERPGSVVKELVENSIDSGADSIVIEIKQGGIEYIRITDNGCGISEDDIPTAFLRHATSKIKDANDILAVMSMGFRGEALSSIASVAKVELVTKKKDKITGSRYTVEGGKAGELEEVGAPNGTTIIVRNLFYNTPARRKFLKSETAEANNIFDVCQHLALARPDISFTFISGGKTKLTTTGRSDVKEIIYRFFGKETSDDVIPIDYNDGINRVSGYLGKPTLNRPNRNFETYFINSRYIRNDTISKSIEEAYSQYLMQHKFPFCVLHFDLDVRSLDVNVHPAKLEVRINSSDSLHDFIVEALGKTLSSREMIPSFTVNDSKEDTHKIIESKIKISKELTKNVPEPEDKSELTPKVSDSEDKTDFINKVSESEDKADFINKVSESDNKPDLTKDETDIFDFSEKDQGECDEIKLSHGTIFDMDFDKADEDLTENVQNADTEIPVIKTFKPVQMSFIEPEERILSESARKRFKIVGQIFDTYWIIEYSDSVYFIDQHAAHEKVNYERLMKKIEMGNVVSQNLMPPIVVTLSGAEMSAYNDNKDYLESVGFISEEFGGNEVSLRAVPMETYSNDAGDLFLSIIQDLLNGHFKTPSNIMQRVATMACKASVKGGNKISRSEIEELIDELLTLDNPYNCPHGRPTIFSMSKYELEKKFKRVVD